MDDLLQQGITAYKAGKRDEARKFFITVLKQSPDNEHAWGWMYQTSRDDKERIYCLKQILRIKPKNEKANQLLNELTGSDFPLERSSPPPTNLGTQATAEQKLSSVSIAQTNTDVAQKTPDPKHQKNLQTGIGAVLFVCIICFCITFMPKKLSTFSSDSLTKTSTSTPNPFSKLIVPAGELAQYKDTYSKYKEVFVTKKDGSLDVRPNDLEELCLDWLYYRGKILQYTQSGETDKAAEARTAWNEINVWLTAYNENDIGTMWTIIDK